MDLDTEIILTDEEYCSLCSDENESVYICPDEECSGIDCDHELIVKYIKCQCTLVEEDDQIVPES